MHDGQFSEVLVERYKDSLHRVRRRRCPLRHHPKYKCPTECSSGRLGLKRFDPFVTDQPESVDQASSNVFRFKPRVAFEDRFRRGKAGPR